MGREDGQGTKVLGRAQQLPMQGFSDLAIALLDPRGDVGPEAPQVIGHPEPAGQPIGGEGSAELLHGDAESLMDGLSSSWRSAAARRKWVSAADRSPTRSARRPSPS